MSVNDFAAEIRAMQADADEMFWSEQEEQDDLFVPREGMIPCCEHCIHGPLIFGHPDPCADCEDEAYCGGVIEEDPCCLLYKQPYLADHEYGCPSRAREEGRTWSPPAD